MIPLMDIKRQNESFGDELMEAVRRVVHRAAFVGGEEKLRFEENFAKACGVRRAIGVGNGTDALILSLKALEVGPGDSVIVPAMTFVATAEAVSALGATPIFVDVDPVSYTLDLQRTEEALSRASVKAIIPVHLYGLMVDMPALVKLAEKYSVKIIEDCAQSHLASWNGKRAGSFGDFGCFSFYPGKNLGAFGDAGAIVTDDEALAEKVRRLANHGRVSKYNHEIPGYNSRLDNLQAAVLDIKLKKLEAWSERRRELAKTYSEMLAPLSDVLALPELPVDQEHVFHLYVVRVPQRDQILDRLKQGGVQAGIHYPIACHNLTAYKHLGYQQQDLPVANKLQQEVLSLPFFPEMTEVEMATVVSALKVALKDTRKPNTDQWPRPADFVT